MSSEFYLPDDQIQQLLYEYLSSSQTVRELEAYQAPARSVHGSQVASPRASRAAVYAPNWMNPPHVLSPTMEAQVPQKQLMEELMAAKINRDSAAAGLQLQRPGSRVQMPPPTMPKPQGTPAGVGSTALLQGLLAELLTYHAPLNAGEDDRTGRTADVQRGQQEKQRRQDTSMQVNQPKLLDYLFQALTPNR